MEGLTTANYNPYSKFHKSQFFPPETQGKKSFKTKQERQNKSFYIPSNVFFFLIPTLSLSLLLFCPLLTFSPCSLSLLSPSLFIALFLSVSLYSHHLFLFLHSISSYSNTFLPIIFSTLLLILFFTTHIFMYSPFLLCFFHIHFLSLCSLIQAIPFFPSPFFTFFVSPFCNNIPFFSFLSFSQFISSSIITLSPSDPDPIA
ncbi:unnamed protein product [Acanthosepion pharaonis]|uniref:Uncharacterized protein n=1 Tax=Acanthosepion pharaonis TaxID=158019 RepID=A0A812BLE9_ACAPH|nr:unnamed protein product [Sepia pharaonis]